MSNPFYREYPWLRPEGEQGDPGRPRPPGPPRPGPPAMMAPSLHLAPPLAPEAPYLAPPTTIHHPHFADLPVHPAPPHRGGGEYLPQPDPWEGAPPRLHHQAWEGPALAPPLSPYPDPPYGEMVEGQQEWEDHEALRWGDADAPTATAVVGVPFKAVSKQLTRVHAARSVVWLLQLQTFAAQIPAGEVAPVTVVFFVTIGSGQSETTIPVQVILTAANGYVIPLGTLPPQLQVPAAKVQVNAIVTYMPTVAGTVVFEVACMAGPWAHLPTKHADPRKR